MPSSSSFRFLSPSLLGVALAALASLTPALRAADGAAAPAAAAAAAPTPPPAPKGPPLALPFNEDFESGKINTDVWTVHEAGDATISLVQGKGGFGKYVLKAHLPANAQRAFALIDTLRLPESVQGRVFGRAYVYVTPNGPTRHTVLTYTGSAAWPAANWLEVGLYEGKWQLSYQEQDRASSVTRGEEVYFGKPIPTGRWFCLEWEANDTPDTLTVWVDGEQVDSSVFNYKTFGNTGLIKKISNIGFGVRVFGPVPNEYDIYYDNVAFDSKRVGPMKTAPAAMPAP